MHALEEKYIYIYIYIYIYMVLAWVVFFSRFECNKYVHIIRMVDLEEGRHIAAVFHFIFATWCAHEFF